MGLSPADMHLCSGFWKPELPLMQGRAWRLPRLPGKYPLPTTSIPDPVPVLPRHCYGYTGSHGAPELQGEHPAGLGSPCQCQAAWSRRGHQPGMGAAQVAGPGQWGGHWTQLNSQSRELGAGRSHVWEAMAKRLRQGPMCHVAWGMCVCNIYV